MKKIKIKVNGNIRLIKEETKLLDLIKILKIPLKKVAIELNREIVDKKILGKIKLKKDDKIEIVHFIGGG
tara:strand:- start:206 stop:415 length:210 start_codon:yes stop_codon:yes gene_type:complete